MSPGLQGSAPCHLCIRVFPCPLGSRAVHPCPLYFKVLSGLSSTRAVQPCPLSITVLPSALCITAVHSCPRAPCGMTVPCPPRCLMAPPCPLVPHCPSMCSRFSGTRVTVVVLGEQLDWMILRVFSNLDDSTSPLLPSHCHPTQVTPTSTRVPPHPLTTPSTLPKPLGVVTGRCWWWPLRMHRGSITAASLLNKLWCSILSLCCCQ